MRVKNLIVIYVFISVGLRALAAEDAEPTGKIYPLGLGLYGDMQLWTEYDSVYGINLSLIDSPRKEVRGLNVSLGVASCEMFYGVSIGLLTSGGRDGYGITCGMLGSGAEGYLVGGSIGLVNFYGGGGLESFGAQVGAVNIVMFGSFSGCQLGLLYSYTGWMTGMQTGLLTGADGLCGVAIGGVTGTGISYGLQIGAVNVAGELHGLQVGFVNYAGTGCGLQIGLVNIFKEAAVPYLPAINFHF